MTAAGEDTTSAVADEQATSTFYNLSTYLREPEVKVNKTPSLPPMKKRDFTLEELKEFDGKSREDGRILLAINGKVFDVTIGKMHYGPQGPYSVFAGRDASRALATFSLENPSSDQYDDLSDLQPYQMESVIEWEMQFKDKYDYVGRLLKPGESHNCYSDEENETIASSDAAASKSKDD